MATSSRYSEPLSFDPLTVLAARARLIGLTDPSPRAQPLVRADALLTDLISSRAPDVSDYNVLLQFSGLHRNRRDASPRPGIVATTTEFPRVGERGRALIPRSVTLYPAGDPTAARIARHLVEDLSRQLVSASSARGHEHYHAMLCAIPHAPAVNWRRPLDARSALMAWLRGRKRGRVLELEVEQFDGSEWITRVRRFSLSPEHRWVVSGLAGTLAQQVGLTSSLEVLGASVSTLWQPHDSDTPMIYSPRDENSWRRDLDRMRHLPAGSVLLLRGETGVGKSYGARRLHERWFGEEKSAAPFIRKNCASIPEALLESELFGHEKGAFTGAHERRAGAFERARGGTLFLDEIGEMELGLQAKLLTALDAEGASRSITPVGASAPIVTDARILFGTNRDPERMVAEGGLRRDLLARISDHVVRLPPLRHRRHELLEGLAIQLDHQLSRYAHGEHDATLQGVVFSHSMRRQAESLVFDERHRFAHNHRAMRAIVERVVFRAIADLRDGEALGVERRAPRGGGVGDGELLVIDGAFAPLWAQICEDVLSAARADEEQLAAAGGRDHSRGWLTEGERERLVEVMGEERYGATSELERLEAYLFLVAREREKSSSDAMRWLEASGLVPGSSSKNKSDAFRKRYAKLLGKLP